MLPSIKDDPIFPIFEGILPPKLLYDKDLKIKVLVITKNDELLKVNIHSNSSGC